MKRFQLVTCAVCQLAFRLPEKVLPPVYCSCGNLIDLPETIELITPRHIEQELEARNLAVQREHWKQLHEFAFHASNTEWDSRLEWYANWESSIPGIHCDCREHWRRLVATMPPDLSTRPNFFAWTVGAHNQVNQRLGKPTITIDQALDQWKK